MAKRAGKPSRDEFVLYGDDEWISDHDTLEEALDGADKYAKECDCSSGVNVKVEIFQRIKLGWIKNALNWE